MAKRNKKTRKSPQKTLKMSFDPHTIEHLGIKMYSNLPTAIAELIANAYDADAHEVNIFLIDNDDSKEIIVKDNGIGMTFDEINEFFLRIGRNRREEGYDESPDGRKATGKKGLGKLAFFGIGDVIEIITTGKGTGKKITFTLEWDKLIKTKAKDYRPKFQIENCDKTEQGTSIKLSNLKRKSSFNKVDLAVSISKLFNFMDKDFKINLYLNGDKALKIDKELKYSEIEPQFIWKFPDKVNLISESYEYKDDFVGKLITTEKPLKPGQRGITLYSNGRLVNAPEFFGASESSHFFSYLTGWFDVNFVDEWKEDVISTNRQTLNWDLDKPIKLRIILRELLSKIEKEWRIKRNDTKKEKITQQTNINIPSWYEKLPPEIKVKIESIVNTIVDQSELSIEAQNNVIVDIHKLIPEYPDYHWRHLHETIQEASKADYERADYYRAFLEAVKRYINTVRTKSSSTQSSDGGMMGDVFGRGKFFNVTKGYLKPDGNTFTASTIDNIEDGQKHLSMGIISGCRNPVSHEEIEDLKNSGLFSEKDCLDALSLLSHLTRRLDDALKS
jgi:uncharacterized protein (TIGR02391 family)